jgi:cold shock protein
MIVRGRVSWFDLDRKFGFVALENGAGDAFLHLSVLKTADYVSVPAGTTLRVRVERDGSKQRVAEIAEVDVSTARVGEPPAMMRKRLLKGLTP